MCHIRTGPLLYSAQYYALPAAPTFLAPVRLGRVSGSSLRSNSAIIQNRKKPRALTHRLDLTHVWLGRENFVFRSCSCPTARHRYHSLRIRLSLRWPSLGLPKISEQLCYRTRILLALFRHFGVPSCWTAWRIHLYLGFIMGVCVVHREGHLAKKTAAEESWPVKDVSRGEKSLGTTAL